jgi:hypothetical protein
LRTSVCPFLRDFGFSVKTALLEQAPAFFESVWQSEHTLFLLEMVAEVKDFATGAFQSDCIEA